MVVERFGEVFCVLRMEYSIVIVIFDLFKVRNVSVIELSRLVGSW